MSTSNRPKAHHKIPRFYLEGFRTSNSGPGRKARIWVYRRGESSPRLSNPRATGFENDFYTMIGPDGQRDTTMEELLAQRVDGPTSAIWHKLLDPSQQLTPDERAQVAIFIAFLFTRTSSLRRMLQDVFAELEEKTRILLDKRANDPTWRPVPLTPGVPAYPISSPEDLKLTQNDLVASVLSGWKRSHRLFRR